MSWDTIVGMNWPTGKPKKYPEFSPPPLTRIGSQKIKTIQPNEIPSVLDHDTAYDDILKRYDTIFGNFITPNKTTTTIRGRLEFKRTTTDPTTGEKQLVFIISDSKTLYRRVNSPPVEIRTPFKLNQIAGSYVEVTIKQNTQTPFLVEWDDIKTIPVEKQLPEPDWDYEQIKEFVKKIGVTYSKTGEKWTRVGELDNFDYVILPGLAGEYNQTDTRGLMNFNFLKFKGQGTYEIDRLDEITEAITPTPNSDKYRFSSKTRTADLNILGTIINQNNRNLTKTDYTDGYAGNTGIGFNIRRTFESNKKIEQLINTINKGSVDLFNPISALETTSKSLITRELKKNLPAIFSSQAILLTARLTPIQIKVQELIKTDSNSFRTAAALSKLTAMQTGITKAIKIDEDRISDTKKLGKDNKHNAIEFIRDN